MKIRIYKTYKFLNHLSLQESKKCMIPIHRSMHSWSQRKKKDTETWVKREITYNFVFRHSKIFRLKSIHRTSIFLVKKTNKFVHASPHASPLVSISQSPNKLKYTIPSVHTNTAFFCRAYRYLWLWSYFFNKNMISEDWGFRRIPSQFTYHVSKETGQQMHQKQVWIFCRWRRQLQKRAVLHFSVVEATRTEDQKSQKPIKNNKIPWMNLQSHTRNLGIGPFFSVPRFDLFSTSQSPLNVVTSSNANFPH